MIVCLSETVMTFHRDPVRAIPAIMTPAKTQFDERPTAKLVAIVPNRVTYSEVPEPNLFVNLGAATAPMAPPTAPAIPINANVNAVTPSTSWAKRMKVAMVKEPKPFKRPRMIANGRRSG